MCLISKKLFVVAFIIWSLLETVGCANLPQVPHHTLSYAIQDGAGTRLGQKITDSLAAHQGQSGIFLLGSGLDAFTARAVLTGLAQRTIDVQYYMFHQDTVGRLLIDQLIKAADRGVRVRILIDDLYGSEADDVWTALDAHPHIHVRLFNPFARNGVQMLQWITRFNDLNHRMHSKSFTVDNQATIVGGRNIGDEYFNADPDLAFADLDILAVGPVVPQVSTSFDQYWNSKWAYSASTLTAPADLTRLNDLRVRTATVYDEQRAAAYIQALKRSNLATALRTGKVKFAWAEAKVISDPVTKKERKNQGQSELLITQLCPYMQKASRELLIVSPYFVPGKKWAKMLCDLSQKGVKVRILTNSLASNDVAAVHAGYARYRKRLLKAGVALYELDEEVKNAVKKKFIWLPGVSKSSLHAKTMVIDRKAMFVGSMNLDMRSLNINNEIGILFFNRKLAENAAESFDQNIGKMAFRLELKENNNSARSIQWHMEKDDDNIIYDAEPYAGFWKKLGVGLIRLLPVESLL